MLCTTSLRFWFAAEAMPLLQSYLKSVANFKNRTNADAKKLFIPSHLHSIEYKIVFSIFSDSENLYFRGMADTNEVSKLRRARKEKGCCNSSGWEKEITALFSKLKLLHSAKKMEGLFFQSISGLPDSKKRSQALRLLKSPFEYRAKIKEGSENKITCNKGISSFFPGFFASLQENPS